MSGSSTIAVTEFYHDDSDATLLRRNLWLCEENETDWFLRQPGRETIVGREAIFAYLSVTLPEFYYMVTRDLKEIFPVVYAYIPTHRNAEFDCSYFCRGRYMLFGHDSASKIMAYLHLREREDLLALIPPEIRIDPGPLVTLDACPFPEAYFQSGEDALRESLMMDEPTFGDFEEDEYLVFSLSQND